MHATLMIPRIVHQMWGDRRPPAHLARYMNSWPDFHQEWIVLLWTDELLVRFASVHYPLVLRWIDKAPFAVL